MFIVSVIENKMKKDQKMKEALKYREKAPELKEIKSYREVIELPPPSRLLFRIHVEFTPDFWRKRVRRGRRYVHDCAYWAEEEE